MEKKYQVICFGEVLWDILPGGPLPGGAPMNVAYHLKKLGHEPALITRIGKDEYGEKLLQLFRKNDISTEYFQTDPHLPTGIVYAKPNEHHEVTYDIVKPVAWDEIQWKEDFEALVSSASFFVFGSLCARSHTSRNTLHRLLDAARTRVLDINLRPPHFDRSQIEYLLTRTDLLKLNEHELEEVSSWYRNVSTDAERIRVLEEKFSLQAIVVTRGGKGAMVSVQGKTEEHEGYKVKVADTVGSGDAFLAGFIDHLSKGHNISKGLEFACAMGAFMATQPGACPDYQLTDIQKLIDSGKIRSGSI